MRFQPLFGDAVERVLDLIHSEVKLYDNQRRYTHLKDDDFVVKFYMFHQSRIAAGRPRSTRACGIQDAGHFPEYNDMTERNEKRESRISVIDEPSKEKGYQGYLN